MTASVDLQKVGNAFLSQNFGVGKGKSGMSGFNIGNHLSNNNLGG